MGGVHRVGVEWEEVVGVWGRGCWAPSPKASPFQVGDGVSGSHRQGRCLFRNLSSCGSVGFGIRELIGMIIVKQALETLGTVMGTLDSSWVEQELVRTSCFKEQVLNSCLEGPGLSEFPGSHTGPRLWPR